MVPLYAIMGRLRLFAPANVVARADEVMGQLVEIYDLPNADFRNPADRPRSNVSISCVLSARPAGGPGSICAAQPRGMRPRPWFQPPVAGRRGFGS
jgi:hypothetical protein